MKEATIEFFYTGSYHIADKRPNLFRNSIPLPCLALVGAAVFFPPVLALLSLMYIFRTQYNCVLDGFAKNGSGKTFPDFSGRGYNSIFHAMLGMLHDIQKDSYHGEKLRVQLTEWAKEGW